jgi:type III restriction enzyme
MGVLDPHEDIVAELAARLDLREPNRLAVETLAAELSQYYDVEEKKQPFEAVMDVATGVGKTFIMTGAMELLFAAHGVRDIVIVTPGSTILNKTKDNFTPGHPKSLLGSMSFQPVVVTADNFNTPVMRTALDDQTAVKIYLFTVQSLLRPTTKSARKVHKFQEGLGIEFYAHLQAAQSLTVLADEHHAYFGTAFSSAVRDLNPWLLLGLTATPDKKTPVDQIIYRYPLAAAIADKLVKTPVIVGRKDDRKDPLTKLTDGVTLLQHKAQAVSSYVAANPGVERINPVMLVVAKSIAEADEYGEILRSTEFFAGTYAEAVLVIHSNSPDESLAALSTIEDPASPIRIVISVGMLKEGWDVKNVYVIASMRALVSEILTEQTLGRGMRLPFGKYTGIEILDTVEVVAHEKYADLLKKAGVLNQAFVDHRTRSVLRVNAQGQTVSVSETSESNATPIVPTSETAPSISVSSDDPTPVVTTVEDRVVQNEETNLKLKQEIRRDPQSPIIHIPVLKMTEVKSSFSLADITDSQAFRKLGATLAADPDGELNRTLVSAKVIEGADGLKRTALITRKAADKLKSPTSLFPETDLRKGLTELVLSSSAVPARKGQVKAFQPLLDAFIEGIGEHAIAILSANQDRAGARLVALVETEQRRYMAKPTYDEVIQIRDFDPTRLNERPESEDRFGAFSRSTAYIGWERSMMPVVWFDSSTERTVANVVDGDDSVAWWLRLHINDLPILWNSAGRNYNPDLIVIEKTGFHWIVETKMDKEMQTAEVRAKREAAVRWANHVSADDAVSDVWKYLLLSETDVEHAKGSWAALKKLGT